MDVISIVIGWPVSENIQNRDIGRLIFVTKATGSATSDFDGQISIRAARDCAKGADTGPDDAPQNGAVYLQYYLLEVGRISFSTPIAS